MRSTSSGTASVNACGDLRGDYRRLVELAAAATPPAPPPAAAPMAAPWPPPAIAPIAAPIAAPPTTFRAPVCGTALRVDRLCLDRHHAVADFHVRERYAERWAGPSSCCHRPRLTRRRRPWRRAARPGGRRQRDPDRGTPGTDRRLWRWPSSHRLANRTTSRVPAGTTNRSATACTGGALAVASRRRQL